MLRVLSGTQMLETDRYTIAVKKMPAMVLMEKAAEALVQVILEETTDKDTILVVCGSGNNGGDGVAAARMLHLMGRKVTLYLAGNKAHVSEECAMQWEIADNYNVNQVNNPDWHEYTVIIDALFGTGLSRDITGKYAACIAAINAAQAKVISVDIPSGVHAGTGCILGTAVRADHTVTFAFYKTGCLLYPGAEYCGKLTLSDVGIYAWDKPYDPNVFLLEKSDLALRKKRRADGNKGTFGKVALIAGNTQMYGAAYMSARAAFLSGAGMVKILTSEENVSILKQALPEAMTEMLTADTLEDKLSEAMAWADCVGIGPGIGTDDKAQKAVKFLLQNCHKPLVLDADALNILAKHPEWIKLRTADVALTPHMGEMSRLCEIPINKLKKDPIGYARSLSRKWQVTVVAKDARTCIATPDETVYLHAFGNSGMATAGSGDVLTGAILGQISVCESLSQAAYMGVLLHGLAGDLGAEQKGEASLTAMDICEKIPDILKQFQ